ncbi:hypothetical protein BS78_10G135500 [Paspalum vaginatum]|nr:hypothetical protein BS78_10G135500 [Paspalum vaginatum]
MSTAWRVEHQLMRRTSLLVCNLRALDRIICLDRAVVINLERVRAVITASEVLVPSPWDPPSRRSSASSAHGSPRPPPYHPRRRRLRLRPGRTVASRRLAVERSCLSSSGRGGF